MNQEEYFGAGSIENLPDVLSKLNTKNVFLVTGTKSFRQSGAEKFLDEKLKDYKLYRFSDFTGNPKLEDVEKGIELYKKVNCDVMVAIGGGSAIDIAKLINVFAVQNGDPVSYIEKKSKIVNEGKCLIAIPTTAGAGSEATHFAVIYKDKEKFSVANESILPAITIVDPQLTYNLSSSITATSGIDALCQAMESYWSVNSMGDSKIFSSEAIKLIFENLNSAVNNPNRNNRLAMSKAANLAGKAINITKTTAPHAISYSLTSYFGVTHGQAVSLTLGEFLIYNYEVTEKDLIDKRGADYVRNSINEIVRILGCKNTNEAKDKINELIKSINLKTRLSELNIKSENDLKIIEDNVNLERLQNNPRSITGEGLKKILRNIL